jgi:integrase
VVPTGLERRVICPLVSGKEHISGPRRLGEERPPSASLHVRVHDGKPFFECKFRWQGEQVKRRIGPAWLERDPSGGWRPSKRRMHDGYFNEARAHVRAAELVTEYVRDVQDREHKRAWRRVQPATFREISGDYLRWLEVEYDAKPSTLRDHRYLLAEPGTPHQRGVGLTPGRIMEALGDHPAGEITNEQVRTFLARLTADGMSPRNVNKHRNLIAAIFAHSVKRGRGRLKLLHNPVVGIEARREPRPAPLIYFTTEEVEAIARALEEGRHRQVQIHHTPSCQSWSDRRCDCAPAYQAVGSRFADRAEAEAHLRDSRTDVELGDDLQDAEAVRLASYTGLRRGELVALRWEDVRWADAKLVVSRAISAGIEGTPKSGGFREIPLSDQAAAALDRLSKRDNYTEPDDLVICNVYGRTINPIALGRRYNRARDAVGLRPLRWHDLRHSFGSLLVAAGLDTVTVKSAMGHSRITTTERYLHARPATQTAAAFTAAFSGSTAAAPKPSKTAA